jgi:hypothetical protein
MPGYPAPASPAARSAPPDTLDVTPDLLDDILTRPRGSGSGAAAAAERRPRSLGLTLLAVVLLALLAAVLYAMFVMPHRNGGSDAGGSPGASHGSGPTSTVTVTATPSAPASAPAAGHHPGSGSPSSSAPAGTHTDLGGDYKLRDDPAGFTVAVPTGWRRTGPDAHGRVRYSGGGFTLTVSPGHDTVADYGSDPVDYVSNSEPDLAAFRQSSWTSAFGNRSLEVDGSPAVEGNYEWRDAGGVQLFACNLAMLRDGRYHVLLLTGPATASGDVQRYFDKAVANYHPHH